MSNDITLIPQADREFVDTPYIEEITKRAMNYIRAGFPVHFRGPAGTGKSTLAKHLAHQLGRPTTLIHGDDEVSSASLVGGQSGYKFKRVRDNFIRSVLKEEEELTNGWVDNQLTEACKKGYTFIYDEFTRSKPEANNIFLSILQDKILTLPDTSMTRDPYVEVHPNFTAIFTSNPAEYVGTHKSQDALRDRMITIDLDFPDYETELDIIYQKARLPMVSCEVIVNIVRALRESTLCDFTPTLRAGIMLAKTMTIMDMEPFENPELFTTYALDVLTTEASRTEKENNSLAIRTITEEILLSLAENQKMVV